MATKKEQKPPEEPSQQSPDYDQILLWLDQSLGDALIDNFFSLKWTGYYKGTYSDSYFVKFLEDGSTEDDDDDDYYGPPIALAAETGLGPIPEMPDEVIVAGRKWEVAIHSNSASKAVIGHISLRVTWYLPTLTLESVKSTRQMRLPANERRASWSVNRKGELHTTNFLVWPYITSLSAVLRRIQVYSTTDMGQGCSWAVVTWPGLPEVSQAIIKRHGFHCIFADPAGSEESEPAET